jgi:rhamnogalacturonan endolyase
MRSTLLPLVLIIAGSGLVPTAPALAGDTSPPRERLDRGLVARAVEGGVYVGWRLLESDPKGVAFNVYRRGADGQMTRLNLEPIRRTTDFLDAKAPTDSHSAWIVRAVVDGAEGPECATPATKPSEMRTPYLSIRLDGDYAAQKVGIADLDGNGAYDFVIKQPSENIDPWYKYWKRSPDTYKLEAYRLGGPMLWRHDLGWAIERGIWYSPYVVYDLDGDGKAEVAVKTGEGDPRDKEGKVQSGPEYLTILDGMTGKPIARVDWPSREGFEGEHGYNYASRNQLGVAYLDGKTPSLIVERGTYNVIKLVAYRLRDGKLDEVWRWDNAKAPRTYWGQGAHWMHAADVDGDGRDEVAIGSAMIDHDSKPLWTTGLGHPDHFYLGDIDPGRPGLEIYYGIESRQQKANGMCLVDARTGEILWGHQGPTRHVHGFGMSSDIDARHPGAECYSTDTDEKKNAAWARLRTCQGKVISEDMAWGFGPRTVYWDADPQRELLLGHGLSKYRGEPLGPRIEGSMVAVADVLGDWREEIIASVPGELRIYTTTLPAADRRVCLMQDSVYRIDVVCAAMGYYQVPMTSYDVASGAK